MQNKGKFTFSFILKSLLVTIENVFLADTDDATHVQYMIHCGMKIGQASTYGKNAINKIQLAS